MRSREGSGPRPLAVLLLATVVGVLVGATMAWRSPVATAGQAALPSLGAVEPVPGIPSELVERLSRVAVRVEGSRCDGPVQGSGVMLDDGTVVTSHHVLVATTGARVVLSDGDVMAIREFSAQRVEDLAVAAVVSPTADSSSTAVPGPDGAGDDGAGGADPLPAPAEPGDVVIVAGYPAGAPLAVEPGHVASWVDGASYGVGPDPVLLTDVEVVGGSSGSGVFDMEGRLVGIVAARDLATGGAVVVPAARLDLSRPPGPVGWTLC